LGAAGTLSNRVNEDGRTRTARRANRPPTLPDRAALHEAALNYLARYAASAAGVRRVLHRRIDRWAAQAEGDRAEIAAAVREAKRIAADIVTALVKAGAINDAAFAESRARSLARGGRSGRAIAAHLLQRGIDPELAAANGGLSTEDELAAALALARRRRIGPFRGKTADPTALHREAGVFARAGFSRGVALAAQQMPADQAEGIIRRLRSS
jgi:regulatory protein